MFTSIVCSYRNGRNESNLTVRCLMCRYLILRLCNNFLQGRGTILVHNERRRHTQYPTVRRTQFIKRSRTYRCHAHLTISSAASKLSNAFLIMSKVIIRARLYHQRILRHLIRTTMLTYRNRRLILNRKGMGMRITIIASHYRQLQRAKTSRYPYAMKRYPRRPITKALRFHVKRIITYTCLLNLNLQRLHLNNGMTIFNDLRTRFQGRFLHVRFLITIVDRFNDDRYNAYHFRVNGNHFRYDLMKGLISSRGRLSPTRLLPLNRAGLLSNAQRLQVGVCILPSTCHY